LDAYDPIPALGDLDWSAVDPAAAWDYWELRRAGPAPDPVLGTGGALTLEELDPTVAEALSLIEPSGGFAGGCLPAWCYSYVAAVDGDQVTVIDTRGHFAAFLAPVTTAEEAILLAWSRDHVWWDTPAYTGVDEGLPVLPPGGERDTGIREVDGGWDVVVFQLTEYCDPIRTDRVRFRVHADGRVTEEAREVWQRTEDACI
ncbi:MAG: hypothetical protein ACOCUW_04365, partial [Gemmatimonadota bacterium]